MWDADGRCSVIRLVVPGIAEPKGSYRVAGGRLIAAGDSQRQAKLATWHATVIAAARAAFASTPPWVTRSVWLAAIFEFPARLGDLTDDGDLRPSAPLMLIGKRDGDKLIRHLGDALTDCKVVWRDDGQAQLAGVCRVYAPPGRAPGSTVFLGGEDELIEVQSAWLDELRAARERHATAKSATPRTRRSA